MSEHSNKKGCWVGGAILAIVTTVIATSISTGEWPLIFSNNQVEQFEKTIIGQVWQDEQKDDEWSFYEGHIYSSHYYGKGTYVVEEARSSEYVVLILKNEKGETDSFVIENFDHTHFTTTAGDKFRRK